MASYRELTIRYNSEECIVLLHDGADPVSVLHALTGRFGLSGASFYFTRPGDQRIVLLDSKLPEGFDFLDLNLFAAPQQVVHHSPFVRSMPYHSSGSYQSPDISLTPPPPRQTSATSKSSHEPKNDACEMYSMASRSQPDVAGPLAHLLLPPVPSLMSSFVPTEELTQSIQCMGEVATKFDRFSRLSTDLANERTLLAWVRTGLAALRTVFAFFSIMTDMQSDTVFFTAFAAQCGMMGTTLLAVYAGYARFKKVKAASAQPQPPDNFGRPSVAWFYSLLAVTMVASALGVLSLYWANGMPNISDWLDPSGNITNTPRISALVQRRYSA